MSFVAFANVRLDAQPAEQSYRGFAVITGVSAQWVGVRRWPSYFGRLDRGRDDGRQEFQVITAIVRSRAHHQRHAVAIDQQRVFRPFFSSIYRTRPGLVASAKCADLGRVNDRHLRMQLVGLLQLGQQHLMQGIPDARALPRLRPRTCGLATAALLKRHVFPATTRDQHEPNHFQHGIMPNRRSATLRANS